MLAVIGLAAALGIGALSIAGPMSGPPTASAAPSAAVGCAYEPGGAPRPPEPELWALDDGTGLVTACHITTIVDAPLLPDATTVFVENDLQDDTVLRLHWLENACAEAGTISLRLAGNLLIQISSVARECPAVGLAYEAVLNLSEPVDREFVRALHTTGEP